MIDEKIYEQLCNQQIIEVDYATLMIIISDMGEGLINTLSIQQISNSNYIIKVDKPTIEKYKENKKNESRKTNSI
jgi:hypothetical protein